MGFLYKNIDTGLHLLELIENVAHIF